MKTKSIVISLVILILVVLGLTALYNSNEDIDYMNNNGETLVEQDDEISESDSEEGMEETTWKDYTLEDVNSGQTFSISDFAGQKIFLEGFAVWCPTCTRQQNEVKEYHEMYGHDIVSISINTDPHEDALKVREHTNRHGFTWRYVIASEQLTAELVSEFGLGFTSVSSAPVVLICEDGSSKFLDPGVKDSEELKEEAEKGCEA